VGALAWWVHLLGGCLLMRGGCLVQLVGALAGGCLVGALAWWVLGAVGGCLVQLVGALALVGAWCNW